VETGTEKGWFVKNTSQGEVSCRRGGLGGESADSSLKKGGSDLRIDLPKGEGGEVIFVGGRPLQLCG